MRLSAHTAQAGRGITWLNAVNDQVTGIGQVVAPGTPRDHLHSLGALLNPDNGAGRRWSPPTTPLPKAVVVESRGIPAAQWALGGFIPQHRVRLQHPLS
ncbi:hypothetical protein ABT071_15335 [Streptomyces sp. NPDC002506]|uniref:hypothetical protein n=1 Tax=Streptomyces sp. NPDC002506 TaxID=3154536 RepID=UPI003326479C